MSSLNKVMVMGRLGQDPELRHTQSQMAVCSLNVATTEFKKGADGEREETTEWHKCVLWGKQAENAAKYLTKGKGVFIEGRLQTRSYENAEGQKVYTTEIVASNVQFLPSGQGQGQGQGQSQASNDFDRQQQRQQNHQQQQNNYGGGFMPNNNQGQQPQQNGFQEAPPFG